MSTPHPPDRMPEFADNVRIRRTPETEAAGYAGLTGQVHGYTTPSVTGVTVVGDPVDDFALCVELDGRAEQAWFAPELVDFVGHGAGTTIRIDARPSVTYVRNAAGGWDEVPTSPVRPGWLQRMHHLFG